MEEDNREKDITTGTQKLRGIRNSDLYKGLKTYSSQDKIEELEKLHNIVSNSASRSSWTGRSGLRDPSLFEVTYSPSVSYGDSVYDEGLLMDPTQTTVNNLRSEHQSAFTQAVNGIIKGAIIAGTTFVDGTFGLLYGVGQGIYNAFTDDPDKTFFSGFWDNPINHAVGNLNEAAENFFVNYRTEEQINGPWYSFDNLTSANFIFDTVVKNIGFTVGAAYSGGVYAKAINGIAKLINAGRITGATAETIEAGMKALESSTKVKATKMIVGAGMSAHAEAMQEAWHTYTDFKRIEGQKLNIKHQQNVAKAAEEFLSNGGVFNSDGTINLEKSDPNAVALFDTKMKTLENAKQTALKGIESEAKHAATVDGMLNIPILTFDNLFMFGKWYAGGYSAARNSERMITRATKEAQKKMKEAAKVGDKSVEEEVTRIMKKAQEGGYQTLTDAEKALVEEAPDYLLGKKTGAVWAAIKGPLREGNEEMAQGAASQGSMYYYSQYSDAIYEAALNPDSKKKVEDYLKSSGISIGDAISYGIDSYYGDINKWEEGFVGAITGLLGAPTFGSSNNRSESTYLGNSKWIGLTGGTIADVREFLKGRKMAEQSAQKLNDYLKNGKLPADIKHLIAQTTFEDDMHKAIIHDDEKKYKDARTAAIFEMVNHFKRTGRIDLLQAAMKATTEFTDEDINQILQMTTKEVSAQEENVKKFRDEEKKLNEQLEAIKQEKEKLEQQEVSEQYTYDVYKEDVANLEEQEQSIKEQLDNVESKLRALNPQTISPYVHQDGTVFTADEIKQDLNHRIEQFQNIIDTITLAQEEIDSVSEGTLTEEQLDTLTWYRVMMRDWEKRSQQITNSQRDLLLSAINDPKLKEMLQNILDLEAQMKDLGVDPEEYKLRYGGRYDQLKSWKNYNDFLTMLQKIFNKEGVQVATTFADKTPLKGDKDNRTLGEVLYNTLIEAIDGRVDISREAKEKFKKDIKDLRDIGESYLEYNRLFDEYQKHPDRIDAAHSKSDKESYKKVKGQVNTNTIDWDSATPGKVAAWIKSNAKAIEDAGGFAKFYNSLTPKQQEKVKAAQEVIMGIDAINKEIDSSAMDDYLKSFLKKSLQKQEEKDLPNSVADMINNLQDAVREDLPGDVSVTYSEDASEEELLSYLESVQKAASEFLDDLSDKVVKSVNEASAAELRKMEEEEEKQKKMKEKVDKYGEEAEKKAQKEQEDKEEEMQKKAAKYGEEAERK